MSKSVNQTTEYERFGAAVVQRFALQAAARVLLPNERVADCLRKPIPGVKEVHIWGDTAAATAHYRNLITCARIWQCPVCAAKITEKRCKEVAEVVKRTGLTPFLLTCTLQHGAASTLKYTLSGVLTAWGRLTSGRAWEQTKNDYCLFGYVRSLEVTYGLNGWHPHLHVLLMADGCLDVEGLASTLCASWAKIAHSTGHFASKGNGCNLRVSNDAIADYIAKWGHAPADPDECIRKYWSMERELTKAPSKRAAMSGFSMLALLSAYVGGSVSAGQRWVEFSREFKGKRALEWSRVPDLRKKAGVVEKSDEQCAEEHTEEAYLLARLTLGQWRIIVANDARAEVLAAAAQGERPLLDILDSFCQNSE